MRSVPTLRNFKKRARDTRSLIGLVAEADHTRPRDVLNRVQRVLPDLNQRPLRVRARKPFHKNVLSFRVVFRIPIVEL